MDIGWPQLIYLALSVLGLGIAIAKHGQPREPYNVVHSLIAICLAWPLLWWGGFFH
jgi:hypothetical protein